MVENELCQSHLVRNVTVMTIINALIVTCLCFHFLVLAPPLFFHWLVSPIQLFNSFQFSLWLVGLFIHSCVFYFFGKPCHGSISVTEPWFLSSPFLHVRLSFWDGDHLWYNLSISLNKDCLLLHWCWKKINE